MEEEPAQGISPEIVDFLEEEYGKTLVIKGTPGSGKTVFALTILGMLKGSGVYLSTRVDPDTLYMLFPWIKEKIAAENIVDATQSERPPKSTTLTAIKPLKYTDVPEFLKSVYTRTEKMENPIVIIDSWDAVVSHAGYYEPKEREKLEHNLCDFSRRTNTNMIFVVEYTEQRPLDYLTDGVIVTESELFEGRRLRKMQIQKLRGCSIKYPVVLFSLYNGFFKSFTPIKSIETANPAIPIQEPINDIHANISTGINDLDLAIGGYGNFNIIEGDYIPYEILARAVAINSLNLGRYVFLISNKQKRLIDRLYPLVKDEYRNRAILISDVKELSERISNLENGNKEKYVILLDLEEVEKEEKAEAVGEEIASSMSKQGYVICYAGRKGGKEMELESITSTHLKTKFIYGIPCIYGESPRTEIYAMELNTSKSSFAFDIKLTPIV